jgi:hypothetical protein
MLFLTRWFGVTGSDAERSTAREQSDIKEITERVLSMQANAAARQRQPLRRGTHAKGVCVRAQFEVFDLTLKNEGSLAKRLAMEIFATPGVYPAVVQPIKPYQQLRYWSNVPFRHGQIDVVKQSTTPFLDNPARPLQRSNPNALQDELVRHLSEDNRMSGFDFGLQFLDTDKMTYWGKRRDAN